MCNYYFACTRFWGELRSSSKSINPRSPSTFNRRDLTPFQASIISCWMKNSKVRPHQITAIEEYKQLVTRKRLSSGYLSNLSRVITERRMVTRFPRVPRVPRVRARPALKVRTYRPSMTGNKRQRENTWSTNQSELCWEDGEIRQLF